jgi:hypothetical protein
VQPSWNGNWAVPKLSDRDPDGQVTPCRVGSVMLVLTHGQYEIKGGEWVYAAADAQRQGSTFWLTGLDSAQVRLQSAIHVTFNNPTTDGSGEHWHFLLRLTFGAPRAGIRRYSDTYLFKCIGPLVTTGPFNVRMM